MSLDAMTRRIATVLPTPLSVPIGRCDHLSRRRYQTNNGPVDPDAVRTAQNDREVGRIFGLTDGVYAIAMTLLAFNLKVPDIGDHPGNSGLRHALGQQVPGYVAFLLSFVVVGIYWRRHHQMMRKVRESSPPLLRWTILLLLAISAMPFASEVLGRYGGETAIAVTVYAMVNATAVAGLLLIDHQVNVGQPESEITTAAVRELRLDLAAFVLAAMAAWALPGHGLLTMIVLLFISSTAARLVRMRHAKPRERP